MPPLDDQTGDRAEQEPERLQAEEGPGESRRPHQGQGDGPPQVHARQRLVARGKSQEILPVLPRGHRKRHKRGKSYAGAGRGRIPGRIDIDLRPKSVENRARAGHWEGDLINGLRGTGNLVTVVERMSRFTLVGYSATKETDAVMAVFKALLRDLPQEMVQSLTLDNGKEYAKFKVLVRDCGLDVFFAKPYHSWERGPNENRNGVVRIVLPKGSLFDNITKEHMERIDRLLNDRPLRCLGWRTPRRRSRTMRSRIVPRSTGTMRGR